MPTPQRRTAHKWRPCVTESSTDPESMPDGYTLHNGYVRINLGE